MICSSCGRKHNSLYSLKIHVDHSVCLPCSHCNAELVDTSRLKLHTIRSFLLFGFMISAFPDSFGEPMEFAISFFAAIACYYFLLPFKHAEHS